jgi:hypothetical protein
MAPGKLMARVQASRLRTLGDLELLVAEVGDEFEGTAEGGDVAVQDVLGGDVAAFDLGYPADASAGRTHRVRQERLRPRRSAGLPTPHDSLPRLALTSERSQGRGHWFEPNGIANRPR